MIIAVRSDVGLKLGVESTTRTWHSDFVDRITSKPPLLAPTPTVNSEQFRTVKAAIHDLAADVSLPDQSNIAYRKELSDEQWPLPARSLSGVLNHVPRRHGDRARERFRLYQYFSLHGVDPRLLSRAWGFTDINDARLLLKSELVGVPLPAVAPDGTELATSLDGLVDVVMKLATRKHSQKVLGWEAAARTVVTLPDDYVHPTEPRIFTVRELARFQGFPDRFEFVGKETTGSIRRRYEVPQYSQVGNAVSPWLAWAVGKTVADLLSLVDDTHFMRDALVPALI